MENLENKTNNELLLEMLQMRQNYEALRIEMLNKLDEMESIEKRYSQSNDIIKKRLTGVNGEV